LRRLCALVGDDRVWLNAAEQEMKKLEHERIDGIGELIIFGVASEDNEEVEDVLFLERHHEPTL